VPTEFFEMATRPGEEDKASHFKTFPAIVVSAQEAVRTGLEAVARERACVIPGPLLAVAVAVALAIPFCIVRRILAMNSAKL
jgi:short-subunit dehydrogenase